MIYRISCVGMAVVLTASLASCQEAEQESKHVLGIIPNYDTSPSLENYEPLTGGEKFKTASKDAFDPGTIALGAFFGGEAQLRNANRPFGQGGSRIWTILWRRVR